MNISRFLKRLTGRGRSRQRHTIDLFGDANRAKELVSPIPDSAPFIPDPSPIISNPATLVSKLVIVQTEDNNLPALTTVRRPHDRLKKAMEEMRLAQMEAKRRGSAENQASNSRKIHPEADYTGAK